jgi:hypothetical protein
MGTDANGQEQIEQASFSTHTRELRRLAEWLREHEVGDVAHGSGLFSSEPRTSTTRARPQPSATAL